jgi:glycosyltransferase involved in cell wall biosynthesis
MINTNAQPLISVVINCYNGEKFLSETIDSISRQTYENWEIIFWDNLSTDSSAQVLQSYSDSRIKYYLASEHAPLGRARNLAIEKATGEWCAFLDSDDVWVESKLEKQVDIIRKNKNIGVVYGQMLVYVEDDENGSIWSNNMRKFTNKTLMKKLPEGQIFNQLLKVNFVPLLTAIFKRELFIEVNGVSEHMEIAEDYDLFVKLSRLTRFKAVQGIIAYYRLHNSNTSIANQEKCFLEVSEIITRYLPDKGAISGLEVHSAVSSFSKIKNGEVVKGITDFIRHSSIGAMIYLLTHRFR